MKLSSFTIIWVGIAIGISALAFAFFEYWQPNMAEAQGFNDHRTKLDDEIAKRPKLATNLEKAKQETEEVAANWRSIVATKTPPTSVATRGINLGVGSYQLSVDSLKFRDNIQRALNYQLRKGGVKIIGSGPRIPTPDDSPAAVLAGFYNYPAIPFPVLIFDLGTIRVQGRWQQIMDHIHSYRNMPNYMAVVHGLNITGTSPLLTATYQLSMIGYIRQGQVHQLPPEDSGSASAAPGGAPGGAGRGGGAGVPPSGGLPPSDAGRGPQGVAGRG